MATNANGQKIKKISPKILADRPTAYAYGHDRAGQVVRVRVWWSLCLHTYKKN